MKSSIQHRAEGAARQAGGKIKEGMGRALNNPDMVDEGQAEQISGKAQRKLGQAKKVFED